MNEIEDVQLKRHEDIFYKNEQFYLRRHEDLTIRLMLELDLNNHNFRIGEKQLDEGILMAGLFSQKTLPLQQVAR